MNVPSSPIGFQSLLVFSSVCLCLRLMTGSPVGENDVFSDIAAWVAWTKRHCPSGSLPEGHSTLGD